VVNPQTSPPRPKALPATAWAVLGLLSFGRDLTGYDLKKWADSSLRFFYWSPAISQIYSELRRLESLGYVESWAAPQDDLRNKRLYRITPLGRDALTSWVRDSPVEPPVLKHGVALRVWLGHLADPAALREIVEAHRAYADEMLAEVTLARQTAGTDPAWTYPELVERWGERYWATERDLADSMLRDLDDLA
jgi:DNA-binding PadR family transcriptional regulator